MHTRSVIFAAMLVIAALCLGLLASGCATKRDVADIQAQLDRMEQQNKETQRMVIHMDSVIAAGADADKKLRNDLQVSVTDLQQQIGKLLENYNDLTQKLNQIGKSQVTPRIQSSPGASDAPPPTAEQSADCDKAYDSAFILVRKGQYEKAIAGFKAFLDACPKHQAVSNAHYWTGECYYSLEKYQDAITAFEYLLDNYKGTVNASRALYKLGRSKQELKQKADAKKIFERLVKEYPNTLEAEQAKERLKELK